MADKFFSSTIALMRQASNGSRMMDCVGQVVDTDRWNSFDRFQDTTSTLVKRFRAAGAQADVHTIQTGGPIGSGRWVIHQAADIRSATCDIISPIRQRLLDYRESPWHVVQWSAATPRRGLVGQIVILDSREQIDKARPADIQGKVVLTSLYTREIMPQLVALGAAAVICDRLIRDLPDAIGWSKFGWGGIDLPYASARLVGLVLSHNQGQALRQLVAKHSTLSVRIKVDIHHYTGTHDVVSGLVRGQDDPQSEVWAVAHTAEPGAFDNASGLAVSIEAAHVLEGLISRGLLPRPKRSIRMLLGYECYGFFHYLEHVKRFQTPLAGLCIDGVGCLPSVCDGQLQWRDTIPQSAGFVNRLGERILKATLRTGNPGYHVQRRPFVSTADTLLGDPKYGFPCPWFESHYRADGKAYNAYHSSADVPELLSPEGLEVASTAAAAYLYYLADAGNEQVLELARKETAESVRELERNVQTHDAAEYVRAAHHQNIQRLKRWLWGGDRSSLLGALNDCEKQVGEAARDATAATRVPRLRLKPDEARVPRRKALITPTLENVSGEVGRRIKQSRLKDWALYWADGNLNLAQITGRLSCEMGTEVSVGQVAEFFEAHRDIEYVDLVRPEEMISRRQLVRDLKALGLTSGMDVMVHSSMSRIGHVIGGPDTVIDAIRQIIGRRGSLMMPSFNHGQAEIYNPLTTPTINGAIADTFWRRPHAVRSDHPTHAVAAIGPKAEQWCENHARNGIWSAESPIGRLIHGDGYILSLGVTQLHSTAYHVAEVEASCQCIDQFGRQYPVVGSDGLVRQVSTMVFRDGPCPVRPHELDAILDRRKLQRHGKVGGADARLAKAKDVWQAHYQRLLKACPSCTVRPRKQ